MPSKLELWNHAKERRRLAAMLLNPSKVETHTTEPVVGSTKCRVRVTLDCACPSHGVAVDEAGMSEIAAAIQNSLAAALERLREDVDRRMQVAEEAARAAASVEIAELQTPPGEGATA